MTILPFPSVIAPSAMTWRLTGNTQTATSPFDGTTQTLRQPGERWEATLTWETLVEADTRKLEAFFAFLSGRAGRFTFSRPDRPRRGDGVPAGPVTISGAGQTGTQIILAGWTYGGSWSFLAGDMVGWNDPAGRPQMHVVTGDVGGPGPDGRVLANIAPAIRRSPADGAAVTFTPAAVFRLRADDGGNMGLRPGAFGRITLDILEALI